MQVNYKRIYFLNSNILWHLGKTGEKSLHDLMFGGDGKLLFISLLYFFYNSAVLIINNKNYEKYILCH